MDWTVVAIAAVVVIVLFSLKRLGMVSAETARVHLKKGALLVDVRSPGEFRSAHLPGAVNIPLDSIPEGIRRRAPDKGRAVLLHCLSGTRSGIAKRQLQGMGYTRVFNLGSYSRAQRIVRDGRD